MQMTGEQRIAAPRATVWAALNDPDVLRQCIPGCQSLERDGEDRFVAVAEIRIGPIGARFKGAVQLSDLDAPHGYTITGTGSGGVAGSAKGGAQVRLTDAEGGATVVAYTVEAQVGGRMAQLGGPIIDATAKQMAGKFFAKFGEVVAADHATPGAETTAAPVAATATPVAAPPARAPIAAPAPLWGWIAALVMAIVAGFVLGRSMADGLVLLVVAVLVVVASAAGYAAGRHGRGG